MTAPSVDGGAIFAASLKLIRENLLLLVGLPFVINLGIAAVSALLGMAMGTSGASLELLLPPLVSGIVTLVAADLLAGSRITLREHVQQVMRVSLPLIALYYVANMASILGMLALILPGLYIFAVMLPLVSVILFEKHGWGSIGRSYDMAQPVVWPLVGIVLRLTLLAAVILFPLILVIGSTVNPDGEPQGPMILLSGLSILIGSGVTSLMSVAGLMVYHALR